MVMVQAHSHNSITNKTVIPSQQKEMRKEMVCTPCGSHDKEKDGWNKISAFGPTYLRKKYLQIFCKLSEALCILSKVKY